MVSTQDQNPPRDEATKGRRTPTRKEAEARRRRPVVNQDRKLAKEQAKEKRAEAYAREREALKTGDERYLPFRDKGKVRRYIRNYVDARWSLAEFLLPAMLVFLAGMLLMSLVPLPGVAGEYFILGLTALFYGLLITSIIESIFVWQKIKKKLATVYPNERIPRGTWFYLYSRMLMARRWRSPKPQVARGDFPKK